MSASNIKNYYEETCNRLLKVDREIITKLESVSSINEKVLVLCKQCGKQRNRLLKNLYNDTRYCPCKSRAVSVDEIKSELFSRNLTYIDKKEGKVNYTCGVCSKDEFVEKHLCSGLFSTEWCNIKAGQTSCRCSKRPNWTAPQQEYRINKTFKNKATFLSWIGDYQGVKSKFRANCNSHGEWVASVSDVTHSNSGCPQCAKTGYAEGLAGTIYILKSNNSCKLGITNLSARDRLNYIDRKSSEKFSVVKEWQWRDGSIAAKIEKILLPQLREYYNNPKEKHHGYTECFLGLNEHNLISLVEEEIQKGGYHVS